MEKETTSLSLPALQIIRGDCRTALRELPDQCVQCCVTSPPYWGLRSYLKPGHPDKHLEIGQEPTPEAFVAVMVQVFAEVWRVLRDDGTLWLNLGDSYASCGGHSDKLCNDRRGELNIANRPEHEHREFRVRGRQGKDIDPKRGVEAAEGQPIRATAGGGLKPKDLVGIPWRVALALQAAGWYLRSDIIWAKPNTMPESVTDRPTRSHEYIFLLAKSKCYFYDHESIKEPCIYDVNGDGTSARKNRQNPDGKSAPTSERNGMRPGGYKNSVNFDGKNKGAEKQRGHSRRHDGLNDRWDSMEKAEQCTGMRNKRDVWTVAPANYKEAHFATFPPDLVKPCLLAGSRPGDLVLDPFFGSGTVGQVGLELGRRVAGCELNPEYLPLIERRTDVTPGLKL